MVGLVSFWVGIVL